jgi:hypothetical protein
MLIGLGKKFIFILLFSFILFGTNNSIPLSIDFQNNISFSKSKIKQTPSISWLDDETNSITNGSTLVGPHANLTAKWNGENPDYINLIIEKGKDQIIYGTVTTQEITTLNTVFLIAGDTYNITAYWDNTGVDLDFVISNPMDHLELGCESSIFFNLCGAFEYPEIVSYFRPNMTGLYKINTLIINAPNDVNIVDFNISISNFEMVSDITEISTSEITIDTSIGWNGNYRITSKAKFDEIIYSSILFINITNWFPPTIHSITFDNVTVIGNTISRSSNILIRWNVTDRNDIDEDVRYNLYYIDPAEPTMWKILAHGLGDTWEVNFKWNITDRTIYPAGNYEFRVAAYDGHFWIQNDFSFILEQDEVSITTTIPRRSVPDDTEALSGFSITLIILLFFITIYISILKQKK